MKYLILILCFHILSCKEEKEFKKDIPLNHNGKTNPEYLRAKQKFDKANLYDIENGYDSIFIRLVFCESFNSIDQVVEISKKNYQWNYTQFDLHSFSVNNILGNFIDVKKENVVKKNPINGWDKFITTFFNLGITNLPDSYSIKGLPHSNDGNWVTVQIATKDSFRDYDLPIPSIWSSKKFPESEKGKEIIKLIEHEFKFNNYISEYFNIIKDTTSKKEKFIVDEITTYKEVFPKK